jgi:hypothetical protein
MSRIAVWLTPVVDLTRGLPSMFQNPMPTVLLQTLIWLVALAAAAAGAALLAGRRAGTRVGRSGGLSPFVALGLALEAAVTIAVSLVWATNHAQPATPSSSGPELLARYAARGDSVALSYRPFHVIAAHDVPPRLVLARSRRGDAGGVAVARHLPPGTYEVTGTLAAPAAGRMQLRTDRLSPPIADWDMSAAGVPWTRSFDLPVAVSSLSLEADAAALASLQGVTVRATSIAAPGDSLAGEAGAAARYGPAVVFLMSGDAWVEPGGIWVAGKSAATFAFSSDGGSPIRLSLRTGAPETAVVLESGTWREAFALRAGDDHVIQLPVDPRRSATPLRVSSSEGFRPVDVDPRSEDDRLLGVRIETR